MAEQKALLWWEFLPFEVVCAHPLPGHRHSSLVPTGIRGPGAQGKLEAKQGACALVRERRQHCFLTNTGCVGCVCRVWMGTAPLAAFSCWCPWCHTFVVPLVPVHSLGFIEEICRLSAAARQDSPFQRGTAVRGEVKEGRAVVAELLGGVECPAGWELPLSPSVARAPGHSEHKCHRRALCVLPCRQECPVSGLG